MPESPKKTPDKTAMPTNLARLLIIDADPKNRDMIYNYFIAEGYLVDYCESGDATFNIDLSQYDIVLVDLAINNNSGIRLVEQYKQIYKPGEPAIIVYAFALSPESIIQALNVGADDYLVKPFSVRELKARVRSVIRRQLALKK